MKKWWICFCFSFLLTGCAAAETFETVGDELLSPAMAEVGDISLSLPEGASAQAMLTESGDKLYFCDGYTATVQTVSRGDLDRTCRTLCGFGADSLDIVETSSGGWKRWDWVWTAVGEGGDTVGRAAVIDDGNYHYCVSVMSDTGAAGELEAEWTALFRSFSVG